MDSKTRHDIINIISPALTYTQNMRLGFYGELNEKQQYAIENIEKCIKELTQAIYEVPAEGASD